MRIEPIPSSLESGVEQYAEWSYMTVYTSQQCPIGVIYVMGGIGRRVAVHPTQVQALYNFMYSVESTNTVQAEQQHMFRLSGATLGDDIPADVRERYIQQQIAAFSDGLNSVPPEMRDEYCRTLMEHGMVPQREVERLQLGVDSVDPNNTDRTGATLHGGARSGRSENSPLISAVHSGARRMAAMSEHVQWLRTLPHDVIEQALTGIRSNYDAGQYEIDELRRAIHEGNGQHYWRVMNRIRGRQARSDFLTLDDVRQRHVMEAEYQRTLDELPEQTEEHLQRLCATMTTEEFDNEVEAQPITYEMMGEMVEAMQRDMPTGTMYVGVPPCDDNCMQCNNTQCADYHGADLDRMGNAIQQQILEADIEAHATNSMWQAVTEGEPQPITCESIQRGLDNIQQSTPQQVVPLPPVLAGHMESMVSTPDEHEQHRQFVEHSQQMDATTDKVMQHAKDAKTTPVDADDLEAWLDEVDKLLADDDNDTTTTK